MLNKRNIKNSVFILNYYTMRHKQSNVEFVCSSNDSIEKLTAIAEGIKTKVYIMSCFGYQRTLTKESYNNLMNRGCGEFLKIIEV